MPPVLHVGSCVDNSRILTACAEMVREGGIGDSFDKLPVAGAAPEWMSEKAIAIGMYFVASGIYVVIGQPLPVEGSECVVDLLTAKFEKNFGATWAFEADPLKAAHLMIDHIDRKRADLGLPPPMYESALSTANGAIGGQSGCSAAGGRRTGSLWPRHCLEEPEMSREVFTNVIRGAHVWVRQAEEKLQAALAENGPDKSVGWGLQTSYYLPMSYALAGLEVKTIGDLRHR